MDLPAPKEVTFDSSVLGSTNMVTLAPSSVAAAVPKHVSVDVESWSPLLVRIALSYQGAPAG